MNIGIQKYPFVSTLAEGKGQALVGTTPIKVSFNIRPTLVTISADPDNTGTVYYGGSTVASTGANAVGFLRAGESVSLNFDTITGSLYIVASVAAQNYYAGAFC